MSKQDDAQRVDDLLRSMEGNFLQVLADHKAEKGDVPKGFGGASVAESSASSGEDTIVVTVEITRRAYDRGFEALVHVESHGCEDGLAYLASLGGTFMRIATPLATDAGWFDKEEG